VAVLGFVLIGSLWLEFGLRTNVLRRWRRLLITFALPLLVFTAWDYYAISSGHWYFDESRVLGIKVLGIVPVDEILFFMCIPLASVLTLEAVRSVKDWEVGEGK
jgi:lycopene cyclase domain-containing protein